MAKRRQPWQRLVYHLRNTRGSSSSPHPMWMTAATSPSRSYQPPYPSGAWNWSHSTRLIPGLLLPGKGLRKLLLEFLKDSAGFILYMIYSGSVKPSFVTIGTTGSPSASWATNGSTSTRFYRDPSSYRTLTSTCSLPSFRRTSTRYSWS